MSSPIISLRNIGKKYKLGATLGGRNYKTVRDTIANGVKRIVQSVRRAGHSAKGIAAGGTGSLDNQNPMRHAACSVPAEGNSRSAPCAMLSAEASPREFWALKDISFDVQQGEVVGIIGRNGAGKSTLLKILSQITEPTEGEIRIRGRVASLLEVGTGFHPELSGRENVYMNGAILGMTKAEIDAKFDEIVAFAGVEKFIDTPTKRYSSGMQVRLAFAVAAHLEPEVLVVDEVLAVGDIAFQKKCMGKMRKVSSEGRTVLFVSHNMQAIRQLCTHGILLEEGKISYMGSANETVNVYEERLLYNKTENSTLLPHILYDNTKGERKLDYEIVKIEVLDESGKLKEKILTGDSVLFRIHYCSKHEIPVASIVIQISEKTHLKIFLSSTQPDFTTPLKIKHGTNYVDCVIPSLPLSAGTYFIGAGIAIPNRQWLYKEDNLGTLSVHPKDIYKSGLPPVASRSILAFPHKWVIK